MLLFLIQLYYKCFYSSKILKFHIIVSVFPLLHQPITSTPSTPISINTDLPQPIIDLHQNRSTSTHHRFPSTPPIQRFCSSGWFFLLVLWLIFFLLILWLIFDFCSWFLILCLWECVVSEEKRTWEGELVLRMKKKEKKRSE